MKTVGSDLCKTRPRRPFPRRGPACRHPAAGRAPGRPTRRAAGVACAFSSDVACQPISRPGPWAGRLAGAMAASPARASGGACAGATHRGGGGQLGAAHSSLAAPAFIPLVCYLCTAGPRWRCTWRTWRSSESSFRRGSTSGASGSSSGFAWCSRPACAGWLGSCAVCASRRARSGRACCWGAGVAVPGQHVEHVDQGTDAEATDPEQASYRPNLVGAARFVLAQGIVRARFELVPIRPHEHVRRRNAMVEQRTGKAIRLHGTEVNPGESGEPVGDLEAHQ